MYGRIYKIIAAGTYSAALDIAEINNASGKVLRMISVDVTQITEEGDAEDEQALIQFIRAYSTSGSGGSSFTALPVQGDAAFSGTCEIMNTTIATGGSPVTHLGRGFNVRSGFSWRPHAIEIPQFEIASGERAVWRLPDTPTDAMTIEAELLFGEIG